LTAAQVPERVVGAPVPGEGLLEPDGSPVRVPAWPADADEVLFGPGVQATPVATDKPSSAAAQQGPPRRVGLISHAA
jgi:hypothetical protein